MSLHADAVLSVARDAASQGDHQKAAALFRSILKHHPYSRAANAALNYLLVNRSRYETIRAGNGAVLGANIARLHLKDASSSNLQRL
jgi:GrpB-like predicted nucleotidyltransferase (UPF0157 family)